METAAFSTSDLFFAPRWDVHSEEAIMRGSPLIEYTDLLNIVRSTTSNERKLD